MTSILMAYCDCYLVNSLNGSKGRSRETNQEATEKIQGRDDSLSDQGNSSGNGNMWSDLGDILKAELTEFFKGLNMEYEMKKGIYMTPIN